jgi:hypothetical protein
LDPDHFHQVGHGFCSQLLPLNIFHRIMQNYVKTKFSCHDWARGHFCILSTVARVDFSVS